MTTTATTPRADRSDDTHRDGVRRVVVGVDGSPASLAALAFAANEARLRGAQLEAVSAWQYPVAYGWSTVPDDFDPHGDTERTLAEALTALDLTAVARHRVVRGQPAAVLLHAAVGAELLVVGTRGRGGFSGLHIGSVSQQCVHHATCPVVVVPGSPEPAVHAVSADQHTPAVG